MQATLLTTGLRVLYSDSFVYTEAAFYSLCRLLFTCSAADRPTQLVANDFTLERTGLIILQKWLLTTLSLLLLASIVAKLISFVATWHAQWPLLILSGFRCYCLIGTLVLLMQNSSELFCQSAVVGLIRGTEKQSSCAATINKTFIVLVWRFIQSWAASRADKCCFSFAAINLPFL